VAAQHGGERAVPGCLLVDHEVHGDVAGELDSQLLEDLQAPERDDAAALHVHRAAPIDAVALDGRAPRVARPLADVVDRNDVGVAVEDQPSPAPAPAAGGDDVGPTGVVRPRGDEGSVAAELGRVRLPHVELDVQAPQLRLEPARAVALLAGHALERDRLAQELDHPRAVVFGGGAEVRRRQRHAQLRTASTKPATRAGSTGFQV